MLSTIYRSTVVTVLFVLILCGVYPLTVTGVAKLLFKNKADGSLILQGDKVVGSEWIGQNFSDPKYFHGRPSAAGQGYDAASSSGSNLGPTNQKLVDGLNANIKKIIEENPGIQANQIPVDLVTASGSGLDPHISLESAYLQIERIAKTRGFSSEKIADLIEQQTEKPQLGLFGEKRVNVLKLNLALDRM